MNSSIFYFDVSMARIPHVDRSITVVRKVTALTISRTIGVALSMASVALPAKRVKRLRLISA